MAALAQQSNTIHQIRVIGQRRIPKETILARMFTHSGDQYDPISVERDFNSLWNTGYFENLRIEREDTDKGIILDIYVTEKPTIREINYKGLNSFSVSDVLDRFKKEKVGLSVESQFDPTRIKRAEAVLREMLAEHGHQFATIKTEVKTIPPASVRSTSTSRKGPTVKVGNIRFTGNKHISSLALRRSMKNLKPIGIPYSLIFENLLPRLSTPRSWKKTPSACARPIATRATPSRGGRAEDSDSRRRRTELVHLPAEQGQAHRHSDARSKRARATGWAASTSPGNKAIGNAEGAARAVRRSRTATGSTPPRCPRDWTT